MITASIKISDGLTPVLQGMQKKLSQYPQDAEDKFVSLTPIRTGNARSNTVLRNNKEIVAAYPYAQRLDQGWSKQAPNGMIKPFEAWMQTKAKQIFGK
jgi:hypothetical protein